MTSDGTPKLGRPNQAEAAPSREGGDTYEERRSGVYGDV